MMTGRGEIRIENHVGYRLKGQRGRKKERKKHMVNYKKVLVREGKHKSL